MSRSRTLVGLFALASFVVGLNLLVLKQSPFLPSVLLTLGAGVLAGLVWVALVLVSMTQHSAQEGKSLYGLNTVVSSVLFLAICILLYAFVQRWDRSWDLTQEGRRQLSQQTVQVLENLDKDVAVLALFLRIDDELVRIARDKTERFLEQCGKHTSHLHVEFLDPQIDRLRLEGLGITHASTQGTVILRCGSAQKVITLQGGSPRLEEREFTNKLVNVIRDAKPKVCFLTGHGERNVDDANERTGGSVLRQILEGESYEVERIPIRVTRPEVPPDCDILVINGLGTSGARADLHPNEIRAIQEFLDQGGRLLVMIDAWRKVVRTERQLEQLVPWLAKRYGIVVGDDLVVSPATRTQIEFSPDTSLFDDTDPRALFRGCFNNEHPITRDSDQHVLFSAISGARTVGLAADLPDGVVGMGLLRTSPDFYAETDLEAAMTSGTAFKDDTERAGPLSMAAAVTAKTDFLVGDTGRTRDARIVVVGDSDFASNALLSVIPGNLNFALNAMAWLSENEELIAIRPTGKQDPPIILSNFDQRAVVYVSVLGTVQVVVAAGFVAYWLRRKHQ